MQCKSRKTLPDNYLEWREEALLADKRSGADYWREVDRTSLYDWKIIRRRYDELVRVRNEGGVHDLLYYLNEGIHGNMGGMGAPALYSRSKVGTKKLIESYTKELVAALRQLAKVPESELPFDEKHAFYKRASLCFGRTALMLSGAGSLGPFHLGVVKTLAEHDLLPTVISGSSAGSLVSAIIGTIPKAELKGMFDEERLQDVFQTSASIAEHHREKSNTNRTRINVDELKQMIEALIPDMTFAESVELSGRYINISVAPSEVQQRSRLLNAVTAPNALIRDAVMASCAVPGVFPPVTLMARHADGRRQPYVPSRKWVDGSITDDLPATRLARMYGINHFISSQANPLVLWALRDPHGSNDLGTRLWSIYQAAGREWMKAIYPTTMEMVRDIYPINMYTRMAFGLMTQEYTADITIMPTQKFYHPGMLLAPLSEEETQELVKEGEQATWPRLARIRTSTSVARCIDEILEDLEGVTLFG